MKDQFSKSDLHNIEYLAIKANVELDILLKQCSEEDYATISMLTEHKLAYESILEKVRKM